MTVAERLQAEKERVIAESGFYIPPYRLSNLMKAAARITDILVKADVNMCYEECRLVLGVVLATIGAVTEEEGEDDDAEG